MILKLGVCKQNNKLFLLDEWDFALNKKLPSEILPGSHELINWICKDKHHFKAPIKDRIRGRGCPYCANKKVLVGFNDFKTFYPDLAKEWDYDKNFPLKPEDILPHSNKQFYWKCKNGHPSYLSQPDRRIRGDSCPVCSNRKVIKGINDFESNFPDLMKEWDWTKNALIPSKIPCKSSFKVHWKCSTCGHEWVTPLRQRTERKTGCPECTKLHQGANHTKSMIKKNGHLTDPLLLLDWDYELNEILKPTDVTPKSNRVVHWKCHKCGYKWQAKISNRAFGRGCPCCGGKVVVKGVNDLTTTHPQIANEWDYKKNYPVKPDQVTFGVGKKYYWICKNGHESYLASPNKRTNQHTGCPKCFNGRQTSFAEQAIYFYVKKIYPDAINSYKDIFNNGMELDIYIPSINYGIEYDGVAFHKENKKEREKRKYLICRSKNIKLIRIKEEKLENCWLDSTADYMVETEYNGKNISMLNETIKCILQKIDFKNCFIDYDVDCCRDEIQIRELKLAFLKENSLAVKFPEIAKEWHPTLNGKLRPENFLPQSSYNAFWICKNGHVYQSRIQSRTKYKTKCKICKN